MTNDANAPAEDWLSISALASARGVNKSSVSRQVKRLVDEGRLEYRMGSSGQKLVRLSAFEHATAEATDDAPRPESAGSASTGLRKSKPVTLASERRRRDGFQADIAAIVLGERQATLMKSRDAQKLIGQEAGILAAFIDKLPHLSEEVSIGVAREGVGAAHRALHRFVGDAKASVLIGLNTRISRYRRTRERSR